jgi:glycosyltransferase involved in cell wall biosynthesis
MQTAAARVWYLGSKCPSPRLINCLIDYSDPDVVYLNSLFSARFSILPLLSSRFRHPKRRIILAPRGELSTGALEIRAVKKRLYLAVFRMLRLHEFVTWHASTEMEAADIIRTMVSEKRSPAGPSSPSRIWRHRKICTDHSEVPSAFRIAIARNLSQIGPSSWGGSSASDRDSIVFFSRIVPKKNLHTLLDAIARIPGSLTLTVAGPAEDADYWERCQAIIASLPIDKKVDYIGSIPGDEVVTFLAGFDLFVLPTLGENFGHVILEALTAGLPVIVGRDTPWAVIEEVGAGWMCDPRDPHTLAERIAEFRSLSATAKAEMRESARRLADKVAHDPETETANRRLFRIATGSLRT